VLGRRKPDPGQRARRGETLWLKFLPIPLLDHPILSQRFLGASHEVLAMAPDPAADRAGRVRAAARRERRDMPGKSRRGSRFRSRPIRRCRSAGALSGSPNRSSASCMSPRATCRSCATCWIPSRCGHERSRDGRITCWRYRPAGQVGAYGAGGRGRVEIQCPQSAADFRPGDRHQHRRPARAAGLPRRGPNREAPLHDHRQR